MSSYASLPDPSCKTVQRRSDLQGQHTYLAVGNTAELDIPSEFLPHSSKRGRQQHELISTLQVQNLLTFCLHLGINEFKAWHLQQSDSGMTPPQQPSVSPPEMPRITANPADKHVADPAAMIFTQRRGQRCSEVTSSCPHTSKEASKADVLVSAAPRTK